MNEHQRKGFLLQSPVWRKVTGFFVLVWEGASVADLKDLGTLSRDEMHWPGCRHELVL